MRHIVGKLSTSSFQRYKVCANRSSDEGVMAPGSRGVGAVFVHSSDAKIPVKRGMLFGEPRVPRRSRSHYLSNAPGLADQLVASRKDSAREGGSCAAYFCKVPDSRESELGLVRYGPASRVHRGVFGPFEGSFPIRIPADPDKFLAIREFHVVHGCVLFPMCPGSQINLLRVRKTLCASVATSALHRGELGFARYDPANGGRRNVPYAKGLFEEAAFAQRFSSDPLQLGPRAKTLRQESLPDSQQVDPRARARWKEDTFMHDVELSDRQDFIRSSRNPDRKTALKRTKNTPVASVRGGHISQVQARISANPEPCKSRQRKLSNAAFARRVFPARNKLIYEPGCVGKITTPATSWNSRFAESIPRLIGIFTGKVHENSSDTPTSGSHNSLIRTPIHANFIPLERGRRELSGDMLHDPF
uniref:Uncharacterized protein n=1 Tax=Fagus sylvatica TaxID=28930 RepID=A0A2N9H6K1_FAGSY